MLVKVQFRARFKDTYGESEYTYICDYPAAVGDIVKVPAGTSGEKIARVSAVDVPETEVASNVLPLLKTVIGPAEYEETLFDAHGPEEETSPAIPEVEFAENIIVIKQLPIIEDQLRTLRTEVENKVREALSLAVTEDTVKVVKGVRAALNKEYGDLEARRKQVKLAILEPYDRFEATYRENIGDLYKDADMQLKAKIDAVENGIKDAKKAGLKAWYEEYRASLDLQTEEMAAFEKWPVNITKTESEKSLRARAKAYLDIIRNDLIAIAGMQYSDEVLVEYRMYGDLAKATANVNERHRLQEEARKRREAEAAAKAEREARERENVAKVEAAIATAQPLEPPKPAELAKPQKDPNEVLGTRTFTLYNVTRGQLIKLRNFMDQEGINYGRK